MSAENFTCGRCGYNSPSSPAECPGCGFLTNIAQPEPVAAAPSVIQQESAIPASHITPSGMYLEPISEAKSVAIDIRVLQIAKVFCGVLALIAIGMLVPFFIYPMAIGPDYQGMYQMPRPKRPSGPGLATAGAIYTGAVAIIVISVGLFGGFMYLRKKENALRNKFSNDGHGEPEGYWKNVFKK